ncbi:MAG: biopolymer transporter ExbD [Chthoniobacterales bacterium]
MRRFSDRPTMHTLTEINVTPLLDLAFVLLIIFIITTPLMENSVNLVVPTSAQANQSVNLAETQTISIDKEDNLTFNNEPVDPATLEERLITLHTEKPEAPVIVRPDKSLSVQQFVAVMDILQRAQISKVGVATRPDEPVAP